MVLIDFIKTHPGILGDCILELGSGTGAVGLACAALTGKSVTLTDLIHVLPLLEANAKLNESELQGTVVVKECAWGITEVSQEFDMVVMSDVVYHPAAYAPLIKTLEEVAKRGGSSCGILWSHRHRNPHDHRFFRDFKQRFATLKLHGPGPRFIVPQEEALIQAFNQPHTSYLCASEEPGICTTGHSSHDVSIYLSKPR